MKKLIISSLALASLLAVSASALAQSPFDAATLARARAEATEAAGTGAAAAIKIDANGVPVLGADGKPVSETRSSETLRGNLRMFQNDMGLTGVEQMSSPGNAARTGLARAAVNQSFTFSCVNGGVAAIFSAASLAFRLDGCDVSGSAPRPATVTAVRFSICDNATKAGTCSVDSDFSQSVQATANRYVAFNGVQLGLGCNTAAGCQLTVSGSYTFGGSDTSLKAQTATSGAESSVLGDLRQTIAVGDYAGQMTEIGRSLAACAEANRNLPAGQAQTCDGSQVVTVQGATAPDGTKASCAATPTCLQEASSVSSFTKSCVRTFPLTERQTVLKYDKNVACLHETFAAPKAPADPALPTPPQQSPTNSCAPDAATDMSAGMTKVGQTEPVCVADPADATDLCFSSTHTEYWVDTGSFSTTVGSGSPSAIGGACDARANSPTRYESCTPMGGTWFGRTLDAASCTAQFTNEGTGASAGVGLELNYASIAGCGFCLSQTVGETCYGVNNPTQVELDAGADKADTCASMDLNSCTLSRIDNAQFSSPGGLVVSQKESYACRKETRECVKWSATGSDPACLSQDIAMGTDRLKLTGQSSGAMNNALVSAALVDATGKGIEDGGTQQVPKLFTGEDLRCHRPTGGIGQLVAKNCCRMSLERPLKGNVIQGGCSMSEAKLAAARRSSYATYIGEYCSRSIKFLGFRKCLELTQTYCVFPGILPRLVQEQGRQQLADMTASSSTDSVKQTPLTFNYYSEGRGNWTPPVVVNGIRVAAWQWPEYCANPANAALVLANDPTAKECPSIVSSWFAACDLEAGCGALPDEPQDGALNWSLRDANPLERVTTALSRYAVVTGACSTATQNCQYTASAWPAGAGGKAVVSRDLTWTLFSREQLGGNGLKSEDFQINNIGDLMFKTFAINGVGAAQLPLTVPLDFSRDGGQTWTSMTLSTDLKGTEMVFPNSDVRLTGSCNAVTNSCDYRAVGTVVVEAQPWGSAQQPNCTGFTAGQMSVLDFGKMDLSEWLASVMAKIGGADAAAGLASQASAQFQAFNSMYQTGSVRANAPSGANFARAHPAEGFGPFVAKLVVSGVWPEFTGNPAVDVDKVTAVEVDWGDCSLKESLLPVNASEGLGFKAEHQYLTPDHDTYPCLKPNAGDTSNVIHKIIITAHTSKSGVQTKSLSVENAWSLFPGANSNNTNVPITAVKPVTGSDLPTPPKP